MKTNTTKTFAAAKTFAAKTLREYGPCDTVRATVQRFPRLERGEMLKIAEALKINRNTANTQFQRVRSGAISVTLQ